MENFLGDYGLGWVGKETTSTISTTSSSSSSASASMTASASAAGDSSVSLPQAPVINFNGLVARLQELNRVAAQDECQIVAAAGGKGAKFERKNPIPVSIYCDGLMIKVRRH